MRRLLLISCIAFGLVACSRLWAQAMASQMTDNLMALDSYHGTLLQRGLLPDAPQDVLVQDIVYAKPWRVRAEVTSPTALKGTLFLYDGSQMLMWWPQQLLGIRVRGLVNPDHGEIVNYMQHEITDALDHYAFSATANQQVAGHGVTRWRILPLGKEPWRMQHSEWIYDRYSLPLKMEFTDQGKPWYSMEFQHIDFGVPVADDAFAFTFPENALVLDWDMQAAGISIDDARRTMNFTVLQPAALPKGHSLRKIVRSSSCLPMVALQYDQGAERITLTESRAFGRDELQAFGKPVKIGTEKGWLYFAGTYSVISWIQGKTLLTLMGNLSFPQMLAMAQSVQ